MDDDPAPGHGCARVHRGPAPTCRGPRHPPGHGGLLENSSRPTRYLRLQSLNDHVAVSIVPRYFELITWRSSVKEIAGLALIDVAPARLNLAARTVKRTFDIVVGSLLLFFALPGLVVVAISIKMSSPGPVLFRQERIGKDNKPFTIYKLRTMAHDAEQKRSELERSNEMDGPLFKIRADPRATPIGRFLEEDESRRGTATVQRAPR